MSSQQNVTLTVPAQPEFLRVARMTASGLASRLGFSIDDIDDLRLALDELCFALVGKGTSDGELTLTYTIGTNELTITGSAPSGANAAPLALGDFSQQILTALVDDHKIWDGDGSGNFSLSKRQAVLAQ